MHKLHYFNVGLPRLKCNAENKINDGTVLKFDLTEFTSVDSLNGETNSIKQIKRGRSITQTIFIMMMDTT